MDTDREKRGNIDRNWHLVDANGKILGRLATEIATLLRGKNRVNFDRSIDLGNYVIVINAEKIKLTGKKEEQKIYRYHTHYPGSLKEIPYAELIKKKPDFVIKKAVKGMLPDNKLSQKLIKRLKIYSGDKHPHIAQSIEILN
ncbi:MAG: 50S ribosomal protein L13 [Atribacterota bacterium]|jgi:large subunit ribosomal protein L13|nr:50S ribosomal protein L13 [Atribacterota bacterium]MDD5636398.1 50S ribosomal protein L13 [Atribacterota bacterium]